MAEAEDKTIECGFCCRRGEDLERPRTLPCRHVHCFGCLTAFFEINHMTRCPVPECGEVVETAIDELPTSDNTTTQDTKLYCNVCLDNGSGNQPADTYCVQCEKKYCTTHVQSHDELHSDHANIDITEYSFKYKRYKRRECTEHNGEPYKLGCKLCLSVFCLKCLSGTDHCVADSCTTCQSHELVSLDDLITHLTKDLRTRLAAKDESLGKIFKHTSIAMSSYDDKSKEMLEWLHTVRDEQTSASEEKGRSNSLLTQYAEVETNFTEQRQLTMLQMAEFMNGKVLKGWTRIKSERQNLEHKLECNHQVDVVRGFKETEDVLQKLVQEALPKLTVQEVVELSKKCPNESSDIGLEIVSNLGFVVDGENDPRTTRLIRKSATLLKTVSLREQCTAICMHKGSVYVALVDSIAKINSNYTLEESIIRFIGEVASIAIHDSKIYTLLRKPHPQPVDGFYNSRPWVVCVYDMSGKQLLEWEISFSPLWGDVMAIVSDQIVIAQRQWLQCLGSKLHVYSLSGELQKCISCEELNNKGNYYRMNICRADDHSVIVADYNSSKLLRINIHTGQVMWNCKDPGAFAPLTIFCYDEKYVFVIRRKECKIVVVHARTGSVLSELDDDLGTRGNTYMLKVEDDILVLAEKSVRFFKLSTGYT